MDPVTRLTLVGTEADQAVQAADAAALAAGVTVREVDRPRRARRTWCGCSPRSGAATPTRPMTVELLRAFTKAGNYVGGAFDGRPAGRRLRRLLPRPGRGRPAQPHRRGRAGPERAPRRVRPQAAPAGVGAAAAGSRRSPGRSTRWSAATPTSTSSSWARSRTSTSRTSTAPCSTPSTATTTPTGCWCGGGCATRRSWRRARPPHAGAGRPTSSPPVPRSGSASPTKARRCRAISTGRRCWSPYPADIGELRSSGPRARRAVAGRRCARRSARWWPTVGGSTGSTERAGTSSGGTDEAHRRRAAPHHDAAGLAVPDLVRHADEPRRPPAPRRDRRGRGLGRVRGDVGPALLLGVRRRGRRRAAPLPGAGPRRGGADRRARGGRHAGAVQGTPDGQGGPGDGRPRRRAARRGPLVRPGARRGPRTGAVRGLGRDHGQHPGAARRGRRLPRRGLRADQAQDRARLGHRAGARRPRAVRRRRAAPGRRQHGVHPRRRAAPGPAGPVRPAADRAAARRGGRARATPTWRD